MNTRVIFDNIKKEIWFNPDTIPASNTSDSVWSNTNNWNQNTG